MTDTSPHAGHGHTRPEPADWAGTRDDRYDLHRFDAAQRALCDPTIRTHSRTAVNDRHREPYARLRSHTQIEADGFGAMYTFCPDCEDHQ